MKISIFSIFIICLIGCKDNDIIPVNKYPETEKVFGTQIDLNNLINYSLQTKPNYINKDNIESNKITDEGATLGRVLFYDQNLSKNNKISCSSCHQQSNAFTDKNPASKGVNGFTTRHSMRLVNSRFSGETKFFWDERATSLEQQSSMPIKDHIEMGFSGVNGDENINALLLKLSKLSYYKELFKKVYGTEEITETKIQNALAQFIRSIQSFDSKYDMGRAQVATDNLPFPNFTPQENQGKLLFLSIPQLGQNGQRIGGGLGCGGCHRAPEFDIDPNSRNNGVIQALGNNDLELNITRSPTLRDLFNPSGLLNGPLMHNGKFSTIETVLEHYHAIPLNPHNTNLDPRLRPGGNILRLNISNEERAAVIAFLKTLTGHEVYKDTKWSDPFNKGK